MRKKKTEVIDISRALLSHLVWKIRLHDIINDKETVAGPEKKLMRIASSGGGCTLNVHLHTGR